jgi:hypothetical protein
VRTRQGYLVDKPAAFAVMTPCDSEIERKIRAKKQPELELYPTTTTIAQQPAMLVESFLALDSTVTGLENPVLQNAIEQFKSKQKQLSANQSYE